MRTGSYWTCPQQIRNARQNASEWSIPKCKGSVGRIRENDFQSPCMTNSAMLRRFGRFQVLAKAVAEPGRPLQAHQNSELAKHYPLPSIKSCEYVEQKSTRPANSVSRIRIHAQHQIHHENQSIKMEEKTQQLLIYVSFD